MYSQEFKIFIITKSDVRRIILFDFVLGPIVFYATKTVSDNNMLVIVGGMATVEGVRRFRYLLSFIRKIGRKNIEK